MLFRRLFSALFILQFLLLPFHTPASAAENSATVRADAQYEFLTLPLERNGYKLHLDSTKLKNATPKKNILLVHGLTYSSHEFDVNYDDYSLIRFLAKQGYAVWRVDVTGYGQSQAVEDGFLPNSDYAADDIAAAAQMILKTSGQKTLDVLGWSWGTVTSSRFAAKHPDMVRKLVLYAPILSGLSAGNVTAPFNNNTWVHAAGDFQTTADGSIDYAITEPAVVSEFQSNCWRYDGISSPNGGRRDLLSAPSNLLILLETIKTPTLVIGGDKDPYLNMALMEKTPQYLPQGSALVIIPGAAHSMMMEKPYYKKFRTDVIEFLNN